MSDTTSIIIGIAATAALYFGAGWSWRGYVEERRALKRERARAGEYGTGTEVGVTDERIR